MRFNPGLKFTSELKEFKSRIGLFITGILLFGLALYFSYSPSSGFYGTIFTHAVTDQKVVALTFDDGPNGATTRRVLDILKKENVPATFFVVGENVLYYPQIAREEAALGNEIENHSMHHKRTLPLSREDTSEKDLARTNSVIFQATDQQPKFFRPPYGFRTPWMLFGARDAGLIPVTWSDLTHDYTDKSSTTIANTILRAVRPGGIIVLHDGSGTRHNVAFPAMLAALPKIIASLKAQGYQFVTLSELYAINHH